MTTTPQPPVSEDAELVKLVCWLRDPNTRPLEETRDGLMKKAADAIERLTATHTGGMTEARALEIVADQMPFDAQKMVRDGALNMIPIEKCVAAILTASREASQGNGAAEMREAAAKIVEGEVVHHRFRQWPWYGEGNEDRQNEKVRFCDLAAAAIRALPLPPLSSEEVTEEEVIAAANAYDLARRTDSHTDAMEKALLAARKVRG